MYNMEQTLHEMIQKMSGDGFSLGERVVHITLGNHARSHMYICEPWKGMYLWANQIADIHLPYEGVLDGQLVTLNYCIDGRCEVEMPEHSYIYMEPGMLCIDSHEPKDGYSYPGKHYTGLELALDLKRLGNHTMSELAALGVGDEWIKSRLKERNGTYLSTVTENCAKLMSRIFSGLQNHDWRLEDYRFHVLWMLYELQHGASVPMEDKVYVTKGQRQIAGEVEQMITANLATHYTITDMAERYGISASALKKYFESVYGLPISYYLRQRRMELARKLLAETRESVGTIAEACGYINQGKFGVVFRECEGMTPLEYRRLFYHDRQKEESHAKTQ
ncbi:MAG: helix-turn-helix transcriptional regulator [Lachnospiraceae bacterium]|nr:helix-turn-helix transcriptional regulator [Lachnospiraceae bacterium]